MICFMLRELFRGVAFVSSFKFQVSGFRFQVSGFRFQVSVFKFQVSGFKFQVSSLKLIFEIVLELVLELVFELVFVVISSEVENYRKDFTQSCTEFFFFFDMLCVERATKRRCTCFKFQVSSLKLIFEVVLELVVNVKSSEVEIL